MKIAVIFIGLGAYHIFWDDFYESFSNYFCRDGKIHFYAYADKTYAQKFTKTNVTFLEQDFLGWPFSTLFRYHLIRRISSDLKQYDYVAFFNANAVVINDISIEDIFDISKPSIVAALHPGFYDKPKESFPFESRHESLAYTSHRHYYVQGCLNAGDAISIVSCFDRLSQQIDTDLSNGILAIWHDESYWNCLINTLIDSDSNSVRLLGPEFIWPSNQKSFKKIFIKMRNKAEFGGHNYLRNVVGSQSNTKLLISKIRGIFNKNCNLASSWFCK